MERARPERQDGKKRLTHVQLDKEMIGDLLTCLKVFKTKMEFQGLNLDGG